MFPFYLRIKVGIVIAGKITILTLPFVHICLGEKRFRYFGTPITAFDNFYTCVSFLIILSFSFFPSFHLIPPIVFSIFLFLFSFFSSFLLFLSFFSSFRSPSLSVDVDLQSWQKVNETQLVHPKQCNPPPLPRTMLILHCEWYAD